VFYDIIIIAALWLILSFAVSIFVGSFIEAAKEEYSEDED
jgi:uncharacterized protein YneF (UPF0154 family)